MGNLRVIDRMSLVELKSEMRADGEYGQGFADNFAGGYCRPAWIHRQGRKPTIPINDSDAMRAHLEMKIGAMLKLAVP